MGHALWLVSALLLAAPGEAAEETQTRERAVDRASPDKGNRASQGRERASQGKERTSQGKDKAKAKAKAPKAVDRSGKKRHGEASYYGRRFTGKPMADGTPFDPHSNAAASKTLPLGTKAEVKNLETGQTAEVEIRDRGPYVKDRIIDVTPRTAEKLDMKEEGVAPVEVTPLSIPPADRSVPGRERSGDD